MTWFERLLKAMGEDAAFWLVLALVGGAGASLLGLSMLIRSGHEITRRAVIGTALHSLMWGVVVLLISYSTFKHDLPLLLGLTIMSGLGAASFVDVVLLLVKARWGISVTITPRRKDGQTRPAPLE